MKRTMVVIALGGILAACGSEPAPAPVVEKAKALSAGEYEIVSEVTKLASSDKSDPATKLKLGEKTTSRACVAADGTPDSAMFIEAGDKCGATSSYIRSGRLSIQYQCNRAGEGTLYPNVDGEFTAEGFEAVVNSNSAFPGSGDYQLSRHLSAKRVGDCPAAEAKPKA